ncbi:Putative antitoxin VapB45 [bacterium HR37]|nr:Putative antitoxin VapB45 [bacterium HR37]
MEEDIRYLPCYRLSDAAFYLRVPISTLRAWVGRHHGFEPLITPAKDRPLLLSFINLVEAYVLAVMRRKYCISMPKIRQAMDYIRKEFKSRHPLAEKEFETDGLHLFLRISGALVNITQRGQIEIEEVIKQYLRRIERDPRGLPVRLYPFSRKGEPDEPRLIIIDPRISFGRPVLAERGISVEVIVERYRAGESIEELVRDYECTQGEIEEAIRYELWREAA